MPRSREPEPVWSEAPRLCPDKPFPPYRFVVGLTPHPTEHPAGHSYGCAKVPPHLKPERWRENEPYLYGIDLYHQGYFWEAHEEWESIWRLVERDSIEGRFLQGLIQNSAAQIKVHSGKHRGAKSLSQRAFDLLAAVQRERKCRSFMGLDVDQLLAEMERHYAPLWDTTKPGSDGVSGDPPKLIINS